MRSVKPSPLTLETYVVLKVSCRANHDFKPEPGCAATSDGFDVNVDVGREDATGGSQPAPWRVALRVAQQLGEGINVPYGYEVILLGLFRTSEPPKAVSPERLVQVNGASLLYGAAREFLRAVTSAGPWGEVVLPSVSFYEKAPLPSHSTSPSPEGE